jgi:predicted transglutaminase-like cysteine proteinase
MSLIWRVFICLGLFAIATGVAPPLEASDRIQLFGTKEVRSANLKPFPKWTGMLERYFVKKDLPEGSCADVTFNKCHLERWQTFLGGLDDLSLPEQLEAINGFMNEAPYIEDIRNWGVSDYWATPGQFFVRFGDCEDYAISKYMSLRALGLPVEHMRIAVVQDLNLGVAHAVLVVYVDGEGYVLDNQIEQVIAQSKVHHYRPYYTINENAWWLHKS